MKAYNSYILIIAILLLLTTVILVAMGENRLNVYYTAYIIEFLIVNELHVYLNSKARRGLNFISAILCGGFFLFVSLEAMKILA